MDRGTTVLALFPSDTAPSERGSNGSSSGENSQQAETAIQESSRQRKQNIYTVCPACLWEMHMEMSLNPTMKLKVFLNGRKQCKLKYKLCT